MEPSTGPAQGVQSTPSVSPRTRPPYEWLMARSSGRPLPNRIVPRAGSGPVGGLVLGLTLGVLWTPCAGPVLGSILTLIATSENVTRAALLLITYAIGAGIPILLIAYGGQYATTQVRRFARYTPALQQTFGAARRARLLHAI